MIEMNLAHQLQSGTMVNRELSRGYAWIVIVLCLGIGVACWWWTQVKQQELESLLQRKQVQAQSLTKIQMTLSQLNEHEKEKQLLSSAFKEIQEKALLKKQPIALLDGVNRSIQGLGIWLDRVQMADQAVEIGGKSFSHQEIEKYIDSLENHQVIRSLPVVEIIDQVDSEGDKVFSFVIRFVFESQVTA